MVQGYKAQGGGSECLRPSFTAGRGEGKGGRPATEGRGRPGGAHTGGPARKQRASLAAGEFKLRGPEASGREIGGSMLSISEPSSFYYLRNFHDMRCKYARVLSVIRRQTDREPRAGEVYIMMSKDLQTVRLYSYEKHSCSLYGKRFDKGYKFMKVSHEGDKAVFTISWDDVVVLLGSPVVKTLNTK